MAVLMFRRVLSFLIVLICASAAQAQHIVPELVAEGPAPPGGEVELAIHMRTQAGWHGYWQNPGDAGLPMSVDWKLPTGFEAGPLRYPVPSRLNIAGLMNYVFEQDYALLVRLKVPSNASGTIPIRAAAHWLACTDKICVPEQGELSLDLPVGSGAPNRAQFDAWRRDLPHPLATVGHFAVEGDKLRVAIPLPASVATDEPYIFPISDGLVDYEAPQAFRRSGDWLVGELNAKKAPAQFDGVVALDGRKGLQFHAVPGPVPAGGTALNSLGWSAILLAVLGALAGGILLNLMPCVFPILALKALHLSKAGEGARAARMDALSYTLGAAVGTGALGIALLAIRAAGAEAGWAFQLQDPRTVMLLLLLAVVITANLLGLFELPVVGGAARPAGSFATGALAAFVATPCAGPFLGAALGTALLLPPAGSIAVFLALGFGLGLPFLLLALIPALQKRMPKPGRWMDRLRRILAIPMGLSALAALWLLYRQAGDRGLLFGLIAIVALAICLYFGGKMQRAGRVQARFAFLLALVVFIPAIARVPASATGRLSSASSADSWSEAKVAKAIQQRKPLFVYFTADWCLSCKVNETTSIDRSEVRDAFKQAGVMMLVGDWTNGDPAITRFLESRGRAGVPLYLWYAPGKQPEELPQVLTPAMLISRAQALKR